MRGLCMPVDEFEGLKLTKFDTFNFFPISHFPKEIPLAFFIKKDDRLILINEIYFCKFLSAIRFFCWNNSWFRNENIDEFI